MQDVIVIDFHCLLKGIDCTDSIEHFSLDNLERFDIDEKIINFCDKFKLIIYHPKANNREIYNKILDYLINNMINFNYLTYEIPKSTDIYRFYKLEKVKESIFLLREIEKGAV